MDAKAVFIGILGAIGLGVLLSRRAPAQTVPPGPTPTPVPIPEPPPPEAVLPSRYVPELGIGLRNGEYKSSVVVIPQGFPMDTNWTLTLRVYDWTKPNTPVFEIARILRWTVSNAPGSSEFLEIYRHEASFVASDFTLILEGSGSPFSLTFQSLVGVGDRGFTFKSPGIYKRALRTTAS